LHNVARLAVLQVVVFSANFTNCKEDNHFTQEKLTDVTGLGTLFMNMERIYESRNDDVKAVPYAGGE